MGLRLYKATGACVTGMITILGVRIRVTGLEALPAQPVLFVVNHFTRFETFLVPWLIYRHFERPVHSLAAAMFFRGHFGRYLRAVGVTSTRDPQRNRIIVSELMTGRSDWVIYPEGQLVKDRRPGTARTGAAVMALKAELVKRRYRAACAKGDGERRRYYEQRYDVASPDDLATGGTLMVPITITYPGLRPRPNVAHRIAGMLRRTLDPQLDEELQVEGAILFHDADISVHFGEPLAVADYVGSTTGRLARRVAGWFDESRPADMFLRRPAQRLTADSMRRIREKTEVNLDHLFCYGLRAMKSSEVTVRRFRDALLLAAMRLRTEPDVRLHPVLRNGIIKLHTGERFQEFDRVEALAVREGVLRRERDCYVIDRMALEAGHHEHAVRLEKMVQVLANELEPIRTAATVVREAVNLDDGRLRRHLTRVLRERDRALFRDEYERWHEPGVSKPAGYGEPFFLEARRPRAGIVLVHGYLACPEQMRPFGESLRAAGYSVYGVRLDGHGTAPIQLREVRWPGWLETIAQAHAIVRHRAPRTIIGGFSLGGVLAAIHAARAGDDLTALFTINAPLVLRNRWERLVPTVLHLSRMASALGAERDLAAVPNDSESPELNYETDYLQGIQELRRAMRVCRHELPRITARTLILQADEDPVADPRSANLLAAGLTSTRPLVARLPGAKHVVVVDSDRQPYVERVLRFLDVGEPRR